MFYRVSNVITTSSKKIKTNFSLFYNNSSKITTTQLADHHINIIIYLISYKRQHQLKRQT